MRWITPAIEGEPFSSSLSISTLTFIAGLMPAAFSPSKADRNIMIGPLSSDEERPKTRRSASSCGANSRLCATSSHCPAALRRLTTGVHGSFCAHSEATTGWLSRCM